MVLDSGIYEKYNFKRMNRDLELYNYWAFDLMIEFT